MKFSAVILALAAAASTSAQSVDGAQATLSLFAVLPSSIANLALTNPSAAATVIVSEFATGTPAWFTSLPTAVQSYFVTQLGGGASSAASAAASITGSVGPLATGSSGLVSNVTSAIYNNASSIRSSASSRASSIRASASSAASGAASSASSAAGAMQTVVSFGAAGIAGLAAILAL